MGSVEVAVACGFVQAQEELAWLAGQRRRSLQASHHLIAQLQALSLEAAAQPAAATHDSLLSILDAGCAELALLEVAPRPQLTLEEGILPPVSSCTLG